MQIKPTDFPDVFEITPHIFKDERGSFAESFKLNILEEVLNQKLEFVLEFESRSIQNTLRGLHYQLEPYAQSKLVSVSYGKVLDIVVDIRKSSKTFMQYIVIELSDENNKQLFIPKGYAHGFLVLSDTAVMHYKLDGYYHPDSYTGLNVFDSSLNIQLPIKKELIVISHKDKTLPTLNEALLFE
jgi:dTDP-4-dehydrorhamnose 3,5-epimerase